jgi:hypothetical protein
MSLLTKYATPAELAVRCTFAEGWNSRADVARNGGEIFGTPTVKAGTIVLNGSTDYVKYQLQGNEFDSAKLSIVVPFWPEFEADDNIRHVILNASKGGADDYFVSKEANNTLRVDLGNTTVLAISIGNYQTYWKTGERNCLLIVGKSGDNFAVLNGQTIGSTSISWSSTGATSMWIGTNDTLADGYFPGRIGEIKIIQDTLTEQDAIAYHDGTLYNYMQRASVVLPFTARTHDPTGFQTLDTSGKGNNAQLGDGAGNNEPDKLARAGYGSDGTDYIKGSPDITEETGETTFFAVAKFGDLNGVYSLASYEQNTANIGCQFLYTNTGQEIRFYCGGTSSANASEFSLQASTDESDMLVMIGTHNGTDTRIFVNGLYGVNAPTPLPPGFDATMALSLFVRGGSTTTQICPNGTETYMAGLLNFALGKIQEMDLYLRLTQGLNNV